MEERLFRISCYGCAVISAGLISSAASGIAGASAGTNLIVFAVLVLAIAGATAFYKLKHVRTAALNEQKSAFPMKAEYIVETAAAAAAIALQIYGVMRYRFEDPAAISHVAVATKVFTDGQTVFADPMMVFTGSVCRMLSVHPLTFIYMSAPVFIVFYYLCYLGVIFTLLSGRSRFVAFMTVILLNTWGYQSERLIPVTLLVSWFGMGVFLVHGLMNVSAGILIRVIRNLPVPAEADTHTEEDLEEWDMNSHKIINARNLAIAVAVLAVILIGAIYVLNSKINRLYDATVNLQEDIRKRSVIYERRRDDESIEGFVIKGSDGTLYTVDVRKTTDSK